MATNKRSDWLKYAQGRRAGAAGSMAGAARGSAAVAGAAERDMAAKKIAGQAHGAAGRAASDASAGTREREMAGKKKAGLAHYTAGQTASAASAGTAERSMEAKKAQGLAHYRAGQTASDAAAGAATRGPDPRINPIDAQATALRKEGMDRVTAEGTRDKAVVRADAERQGQEEAFRRNLEVGSPEYRALIDAYGSRAEEAVMGINRDVVTSTEQMRGQEIDQLRAAEETKYQRGKSAEQTTYDRSQTADRTKYSRKLDMINTLPENMRAAAMAMEDPTSMFETDPATGESKLRTNIEANEFDQMVDAERSNLGSRFPGKTEAELDAMAFDTVAKVFDAERETFKSETELQDTKTATEAKVNAPVSKFGAESDALYSLNNYEAQDWQNIYRDSTLLNKVKEQVKKVPTPEPIAHKVKGTSGFMGSSVGEIKAHTVYSTPEPEYSTHHGMIFRKPTQAEATRIAAEGKSDQGVWMIWPSTNKEVLVDPKVETAETKSIIDGIAESVGL